MENNRYVALHQPTFEFYLKRNSRLAAFYVLVALKCGKALKKNDDGRLELCQKMGWIMNIKWICKELHCSATPAIKLVRELKAIHEEFQNDPNLFLIEPIRKANFGWLMALGNEWYDDRY